jgi:YVTN family beta-propeller protein
MELLGIMAIITIILLPCNVCAMTLESMGNRENAVEAPYYRLSLLQGGLKDGLAINNNTNKIYVANSGSDNVIAIDGDSGNMTDIRVGRSPSSIAVNPITNTIYMTHNYNDEVTVIEDGSKKNETYHVGVGKIPFAIAVNPITNKIYVAEKGLGNVTEIDEFGDVSDIPVGGHPTSIAVNPITNKIYVVNSNSDTVSVIDGNTYTKMAHDIHVGQYPSAIAVNPITNKIYVVNSNSDTVSVIDGNTYTKMAHDIHVGQYPSAIAVNPITNKIYVVNSNSDTVSVIDGNTNKNETDIHVGKTPEAIAVNPNENTIYVANFGLGGSVTVIDGHTNKVAAGVTFNINPTVSGQIICNRNVSAPTNQYLYIGLGTQCTALSNKGFEFSSWVENSAHNSTKIINVSTVSDSPLNSFLDVLGLKPNDPAATLYVSQFGTFTAHFKALPTPIPPAYWIPLYGVIVSSIVGWSIPTIIGAIKSKKQGRSLGRYQNEIDSLHEDTKLDKIKKLDDLSAKIKYSHIKGKISNQQYEDLKNEISVLYEEILGRKIDSLNKGIVDLDNEKMLDDIKNQVTEVYAKGKITDTHYNLLNKKISEYEKRNAKS